jgi:hypothetical protein
VRAWFGCIHFVFDEQVQKPQGLLVRQTAVVHHLHDLAALLVWRQVGENLDGGLVQFLLSTHFDLAT